MRRPRSGLAAWADSPKPGVGSTRGEPDESSGESGESGESGGESSDSHSESDSDSGE